MLKKFMLEIAPTISGVLIVISYWPQIWTTLSTKDVSGQSVSFWILLCLSLLGFTIQQAGMIIFRENKEETPVLSGVIAQGLNLAFALIMLVLVVWFKMI